MERTEAIEVIRKNYPHVGSSGTEFETALRELIPELEEREDEKIKSALLRGFNSMMANRSIKTFGGEPIRSILSYLEKQKEQKTEIKYVYPKFRVGDEIVEVTPNGYCPSVVVKYIGEGAYICESKDGKRFLSLPLKKENEYRLVDQKPAEWSEEDEAKITFLERLIRYNVPEGQYGWVDGHKGGFVTKLEAISILKSLRPSWKPSEEQMKALEKAIVKMHTPNDIDILAELRDNLKKLLL